MRHIIGVAVAVLLLAAAAERSGAVVDVHQPLFPPVPLDPLDFPRHPSPIDLELRTYCLPDDVRVEWYHLNGWTRLTSRVALGGGLSYAVVESEDEVRNGGAPAWVDLSTHLGGPGALGFAFDIDGTIPFGDEGLYPAGSDAASVGLRLRLSLGHLLTGRTWLGWFARRVSPPPSGQRPDGRPGEDWPSGSGLMAAWHAAGRRWDGALQLRYDMAGLPETFWGEMEWTWYPVEDLGLRLGAAATTGPSEHRPVDWSWLVGIRWRPGPVPSGSPAPSSGK